MCAGTEEGGFLVSDGVWVGWDKDTKVNYNKNGHVTSIMIKN